MDPQQTYINRHDVLTDQLKKLQQKKSVFGVVRFGTVVIAGIVVYLLWSLGLAYIICAAIILAIVFTQLVLRDLNNKEAIAHTARLIAANENELKALRGEYFQYDNGAVYQPKDHEYAADMDVLGHASLFQFLNRTTSDMGSKTLAAWLLQPASVNEVIERQTAVRELNNKFQWRQEVQARGMEARISEQTRHRLLEWIHEPAQFIVFKYWQWLRYLLPLISTGVATAVAFGWVPLSLLYASLLVFGTIAYQLNKKIAPIHNKLSRMTDEIDVLSKSILLIEQESFTSSLLKNIRDRYQCEGSNASGRIRNLKRILDKLDMRYNIVVSAPLNLLLLWNLQHVLELEHWKTKQKDKIDTWFKALGELEALNSFATLHFNHPNWCMPSLEHEYFYIDALNLGHPLIPEKKRITNYIHLHKRGELMLVTGSNMAGKSTYLRSVGINVILAMAGAPVCATSFSMSPVQLISSMRIADNLEESTSTFYAELKKLKTIIEKVNRGDKVFVLLDEMLRGTNSVDRHTGSEALIRQLIRRQSAAIVATHDLGLTNIASEFSSAILNFHFDVQVEKDELYFDYKLKSGICSSLNASILMKKIGIEL